MRPNSIWTFRVSASSSGVSLGDVGHLLELPDEVRIVLDPALELDALDALDEDAERPVRDLDQLVDDCGGADARRGRPTRAARRPRP